MASFGSGRCGGTLARRGTARHCWTSCPDQGSAGSASARFPRAGLTSTCAEKRWEPGKTADTRLRSDFTRAVARLADRGLGRPLRGARQTVRRRSPRSRARRCRRHRQRREADSRAGIRELRRQPGRAHRQTRGTAGARCTGLRVSHDALGDCGVRPSKAEWSRFVGACNRVRFVHAESA